MTTTETYTGSDASGSDGESNRVLTINNQTKTSDNGFNVWLDGLFLNKSIDFTVNHLTQNSQITFLNSLGDSQVISVQYDTELTVRTSSQTPLCPSLLMKEIDKFGETLTLRVVSTSSTSKWGDITESTSDSTIRGVVNMFGFEEQLVKEGIFRPGDLRIFLKPGTNNISIGNHIQRGTKWYKIVEVIDYSPGDVEVALEVLAKKI